MKLSTLDCTSYNLLDSKLFYFQSVWQEEKKTLLGLCLGWKGQLICCVTRGRKGREGGREGGGGRWREVEGGMEVEGEREVGGGREGGEDDLYIF